jgi:hypothetical protein
MDFPIDGEEANVSLIITLSTEEFWNVYSVFELTPNLENSIVFKLKVFANAYSFK